MSGNVNTVTKIFGMFDKIDDIVYEPITLLCDALRQPLKQIDHRNEMVKIEQEQKLKKDLQKFEADLEIDKEERKMRLSIEERRLEEEINQMIRDNEMARRDEMIRLEAKYRKDMANAAAELAQIITNLEVETRRKIISLYTEKENEYLNLQARYKKDMFETVKTLRELFPDGSGEDIIQGEVATQLKLITERSSNFTSVMNKDMQNVFNIIDMTMSETKGIAAKYFTPEPNQFALTENIAGYIEEN